MIRAFARALTLCALGGACASVSPSPFAEPRALEAARGPGSARAAAPIRRGEAEVPRAPAAPPEPGPQPATSVEVAEAEAPRYPFHAPLPEPDAGSRAPATRYAGLSPKRCRAELEKRGVPVGRAGRAAPGVATPLRLSGPLGGVRFVAPGKKSPYGILDCRLALALADLAELLGRSGVVEARVDNFYRPRARLAGRRKPSQHAHGLAVDLVSLKLQDGTELSIERDWRGALGAPACGPESRPEDPTPETVALRNVVCEIFREGIFHHVLTPNYDAAHRDHLHMDIKRKAGRLVLR